MAHNRSKAQIRDNLNRLGINQMADETIAKRSMSKAQKDRIRAAVIETMLLKHAKGATELSATQIKALEILLDRRKPKLSAVDNTVTMAESWSDSLQRIAAARKEGAQSASVTPIAAPLQPDSEQDSTEDAA